MIRSSVSLSVVNRSRGKPANAERVVFITVSPAIPARTVDAVAADGHDRAVRVSRSVAA